jgi:hypothetical protein
VDTAIIGRGARGRPEAAGVPGVVRWEVVNAVPLHAVLKLAVEMGAHDQVVSKLIFSLETDDAEAIARIERVAADNGVVLVRL